MKEKWTAGKTGGCVVSDTPNRHGNDDNVDYYGGYLVAESIPKQEYVNLIAAAPDLLEALQDLLEVVEETTSRGKGKAAQAARKAIAKAKGGE